MADPTPDIKATRYRVELGTYGADVAWDPTTDGWQVQSPAVSLVTQALAAMGLSGAVPDPAGFRYPTHEDAERAAVTVLQAANAYMSAVIGTQHPTS